MQHYKGFSLIELVITLAVVAIMSSMVLTLSSAFLQDNRIATANNDLVSSITLARSTAVIRGQRASICSSSNGTSCTGTAWELGWIVFTDEGTAAAIDGDDQIIKISHKTATDISISGAANFVQFKPEGSVASVCVDCFDKIGNQKLETTFATALQNLSPVSLAYAGGGSSGSSGGSSKSGSSGGSGGSNKEPKIHCVAPESKVKHGSSGKSSSSSASIKIKNYTDYALNLLEQLSPIPSAFASSGAKGGSGSSGGKGPAKNSGTSATCDDGSGAGGGIQSALQASSLLVCDSSRRSERGSLISVSAIGRVSREKVICD